MIILSYFNGIHSQKGSTSGSYYFHWLCYDATAIWSAILWQVEPTPPTSGRSYLSTQTHAHPLKVE